MINLDENPWNDITSEGNEAYTGVHAYKVNKYISTPDEELEKEIEIRKLTDNKKLYKYKEERRWAILRQITSLEEELEIINNEMYKLNKRINEWP